MFRQKVRDVKKKKEQKKKGRKKYIYIYIQVTGKNMRLKSSVKRLSLLQNRCLSICLLSEAPKMQTNDLQEWK